jgi:hypothetical protein
MRTDAINRFASSELCRSLQDGGKTPLTQQVRIFRTMPLAARWGNDTALTEKISIR